MGTETGSTGDPPGGGHPQGRVAVPRIAVAAALVVTGGYLTTVVATTVVSRLSLGIAMVSALAIAAFVPGRPFPAWVRAHIVAAAVLVALVSPLNGAAAPIGLACLPLAGLLRAVSQARTFWTLLWLPIVMTFLAGCVAFMLFVLGAFFVLAPLGIDESWVPGAAWAAANAIAWTTAAVRLVESAAASYQDGGVRAWRDALRAKDPPA